MKNITNSFFNLSKIKKEWLPFFEKEFKKPYFKKLIINLQQEYGQYNCYPDITDIFKIFELISPSEIKVVILGQDPYHEKNQAHGLAFSVQCKKIPPSLKNLFKELKNDLNINRTNGNLLDWVAAGIFLYNCTLTVREHLANSHSALGWKYFTNSLLHYLKNDIIYLLLGKKAESYIALIKSDNIIITAHPSPFSYHLFKNSKPFSKINDILLKNNKVIIKW